jgi:hypothetical protein
MDFCEPPWATKLYPWIPTGYALADQRKPCVEGFQGNKYKGKFTTCHLKIYFPGTLRYYATEFIVAGTFLLMGLTVFYFWVRRKLKQRYLLAKAERRRSRKSSENDATGPGGGAFGHR